MSSPVAAAARPEDAILFGMRRLCSLAILLAAATANAGPREFTLTWNEHMHRSDGTAKTVKSSYTVKGTKLHYESTYEGPEPDKPRNKNQRVDVELKNDAVVDRALAALDKIAVSKTRGPGDPAMDDQTGCLTRGKHTRCETVRGDEKATKGARALMDLTDTLTENLPRTQR